MKRGVVNTAKLGLIGLFIAYLADLQQPKLLRACRAASGFVLFGEHAIPVRVGQIVCTPFDRFDDYPLVEDSVDVGISVVLLNIFYQQQFVIEVAPLVEISTSLSSSGDRLLIGVDLPNLAVRVGIHQAVDVGVSGVQAFELGRDRASAIVAFFGTLRVRAIAAAVAVPVAVSITTLRGQRWARERNRGHRDDRTAGEPRCYVHCELHLDPLCGVFLGHSIRWIGPKSRLIEALVWQNSLIVANARTMISCSYQLFTDSGLRKGVPCKGYRPESGFWP